MPVYEYTCNACGANVSVFTRSISSPVSAKCEQCGGTDLRRLISKFGVRINKSGSIGDRLLEGFDESNPHGMTDWARHMREEMHGDMGTEMDEMISRLDRGESFEDMGFGGDDDF